MLLLHVTPGLWGLSPRGNVALVALGALLVALILGIVALPKLRRPLMILALLIGIGLVGADRFAPDAGAHSAAYGPQYCGHDNYVYSNGNYRDEYAYGQWVDLYTHRHTINHWVKTWPWQSGQPDFWHTYTADCSS